jgi:poly-beta-1,6-N-acetyl-D-glucosamine synthase
MRRFNLSIGIMAYNEENGIGRLLHALLKQELVHAGIAEIIVVASGCTDRTTAIVQQWITQDSRIHLQTQTRRKGKASAINLFLSVASGDICILISADTVPEPGAIDRLITPFDSPQVGMTGARPVPINPPDTFVGYAVNLMWSMHHAISLTSPKLGELIAFRNSIHKIPEDTAVDEASIEAVVIKGGYRLRYVPTAILRNKGPETVKDFIRQRRRIAAGHLQLFRDQGYRVSTHGLRTVLRVLVQEQKWTVREMTWTAGTIILEAVAKILGMFDLYVRKQIPYIWEISKTTKSWG